MERGSGSGQDGGSRPRPAPAWVDPPTSSGRPVAPPPAAPPTTAAPPPAWPSAPPPAAWQVRSAPAEPPRPFRPLRTRARVTMVLLGLTAIAQIVAFGVAVMAHGLFDRYASTPMTVTSGQLDRLALVEIAVDVVSLALLAGTAAAFIAWLWQACSNLPAFGVHDHRFGRGWAIGAWFVPLASLVIPKLLVDDTWRASSPSTVTMPWRQRRVPAVFHAWWALFLLWNVGSLVGSGIVGSATEPATFRTAAAAAAVTEAFGAVGAVLAIAVVVAISRRQEQRAGLRPHHAAPALRVGVLVAGLVPALLVAAVLGRVSVPPVAGPTTPLAIRDAAGIVVAAGAERYEELRVGDCFDATPGMWWGGPEVPLGVEVVPCDQAHDHVVMEVVELEAGSLAPYPGDDELLWQVDDLCLDVFFAHTADRRDVDWLDVFYLLPTYESWSAGDREVVCILGTIDGRGLHLPHSA